MRSALLLSTLVGFALLIWRPDASIVVPALCAAGLGAVLPDRILTSRIRARSKRLRRGIPAALDLMVWAGGRTVAGSDHGVDQPCAEEHHPDLSSELAQVYLELRAREGRVEALRNLTDRTGEQELRKLSNLLIDSDRFGAGLGPSLRTHAKYLRVVSATGPGGRGRSA